MHICRLRCWLVQCSSSCPYPFKFAGNYPYPCPYPRKRGCTLPVAGIFCRCPPGLGPIATPSQFWSKNHPSELFFLLSWLNKWFYIFFVSFLLFLWFRRLWTTLFVLISRLWAVCFWFPVLVRCLFYSGWNIRFEQVHIRSMTMTLVSSTLQIRRHEYSGEINIVILVIFVCIDTLPFYAINMNVVSLITDSSFLFLANLDLYCIGVLYQFEWMNIVYFCKKKKKKFWFRWIAFFNWNIIIYNN